MPEQDLLTAEEAAKILRVNLDTIRRYLKERRIKAIKVGNRYRIRRSDLDSFLAGGTEQK